MSLFLNLLELAEKQRSEAKEKKRSDVAVGSQELLQKAKHGQPNGPDERSFTQSMGNLAVGENMHNSRTRMKEPPGNLRWGGKFQTDRDVSYCTCGHLKTEHTLKHFQTCPCTQVFDERKK